MKKNLDYYQHYTRADQHPKFKMLRVEFGWEGDGRFWAINNRIGLAENCCLDLSKKYNKSSMASDLGMSLKELDSFLDFLADPEGCGLIRYCEDGKSITTDIIQENYERVMGDRAAARDRGKKGRKKKGVDSGEKPKSSGEELRTKKKLLDFLDAEITANNLDGHRQTLCDFFEYRMNKKKKDRYRTEAGIKGLIRECLRCKERYADLDECIAVTIQREWLTPDPDYLDGKVEAKVETGASEGLSSREIDEMVN